MPNQFFIKGQFVDIPNEQIYPAKVTVQDGLIYAIEKIEEALPYYIMPGFIDAHIHIESSMLVPTAFSRIATTFGTVATVSDPHEIANVCGVEGVLYMIENARNAALKFFFGAPSCVPATPFEHAGATLNAAEVQHLLEMDEIYYLAEMMNFPGVLAGDPSVLEKIRSARALHKPVDGHAPGMRGNEVLRYAAAGITTDHECTSKEEALEKIAAGMHILIREGSAAKNFDDLVELFFEFPRRLMFCSDDKHPDELMKGHINQLVAKAIAKGARLFDVLHAACLLPKQHYDLPVGTLKVGDAADFILVKDLEKFEVVQTYINGVLVAENGTSFERNVTPKTINHFHASTVSEAELHFWHTSKEACVRVIDAIDGQLITTNSEAVLPVVDGQVMCAPDKDVLKIVVVNRYRSAQPAIAFIRNFGLKRGAIASTVAHDSHNIIALGVDDVEICHAINCLIEVKGGIVAVNGQEKVLLPLPIGGLMSDQSAERVAMQYMAVDRFSKDLGSTLTAPFMTLSFMALPVIPSLKLTDMGLFDVDSFTFTELIK